MVDELRVLKLPEDSSVEVMIGMGCMAWSGGMLNASPFCLWRHKDTARPDEDDSPGATE